MATFDLCTLSDVRAFIQMPTVDTEQDAIISSLVTAASKAILRFSRQEFAPANTTATRSFEYDRRGFLDLSPYSLQTITTIQVDTDDASPTTLTTDQWRPYPLNNPDGVYSALRLWIAGGRAIWLNRRVAVTGVWGYPSIPEDVALAAKLTVAIWLRREVSAFSKTMNLDVAKVELPSEIPTVAKGLLTPYVRQVVV